MDGKKFACGDCGKTFSQKSHLQRHFRSSHNGTQIQVKKPVPCTGCGKSFTHAKTMKVHYRATHALNVIGQSPKRRKEQNKENVNNIAIEECPLLMKDLPKNNYQYNVVEYNEKNGASYWAKFYFHVCSLLEGKLFITELQCSSKRRYRQEMSEKKTNSLMIRYACHHNSQKKSEKNRKNFDCPGKLILKVIPLENDNENKFQCKVEIRNEHNHETNNAAALNLLLPGPEVQEDFKRMFQAGLSPEEAVKRFDRDLRLEQGDEYFLACADRSLCPDEAWAYHYYYSIYKKNYGAPNGEKMLECLKDAIQQINADYNETCAKISVHEDFSFAIALMLPTMRRFAKTPLAGDIIFLDSSGNMDRFNCRVFIMACSSPCGGLPVGVIMTTSETEDAITEALKLHSSLLDEECFGGRGTKGPFFFMTDICDAEQNSLNNVYPESIVLLCIFHVLQAYWRYLQDGSHNIKKEHRPQLYRIFKRFVYAKDMEELQSLIKNLENEVLLQTYQNIKKYLTDWLLRFNDWGLLSRKSEHLRGHNTNNILEAAFRVLKDKILQRRRAHSPVQLLDFLAKDYIIHYENKILKMAAGRTPAYLKKKVKKYSKFDKNDYKIEQLEDSIYSVENLKNKNVYQLNMELCLCTCPMGDCGAPCKHYHITKQLYPNVKHVMDLPVSPKDKLWLHYLATGEKCKIKNWYNGLTLTDHTENPVDENALEMSALVEREETEIANLREKSSELTESTNEKENKVEDTVENMDERKKEITDAVENVRSKMAEICRKIEESPDDLLEAANAFCKNVMKIRTTAGLKSALFCFGKFNGLKSKTRNAAGSKIGVQPTAISRRKSKLGGRRAMYSGRPSKAVFTEHSYNKDGTKGPRILPPKRRTRPAPHNLEYCLTENIALGKSH